MPTYEYFCSACEHSFELFQSMKDQPISQCPNCQTFQVERRFFSAPAFKLKGGGWYKTDYSSSTSTDSSQSTHASENSTAQTETSQES